MPLKARRRKILIASGIIVAGSVVIALLVMRLSQRHLVRAITGAVLVQDKNPREQRPISNALVTVVSRGTSTQARTDAKGYFQIRLEPRLYPGTSFTLRCTHPDYHPLETSLTASQQIHLVRLTPLASRSSPERRDPQVSIGNPRIRYAMTMTTSVNIGTVVRTFEVRNEPNVPCNNQPPCSPDGRWKAAIVPMPLDTGDDSKQFRQVRVSCIGGPCPFTNIEKDEFSRGGRRISVSVRNWSDTVTYLIEAEVVQTMPTQMVRHSYPVIFGRAMNFTLPASAQGPSIEAEVEGAEIVFPLGPKLRLSWAECRLERGSDGAQLYRCALKPDYRFAPSQ
jgi:hypothetical protein